MGDLAPLDFTDLQGGDLTQTKLLWSEPLQADEQFMRDVLDEVISLRRRVPHGTGLMAEVTRETKELVAACWDGSSNLIYVEAVQLCAAAMCLALEGDTLLDMGRILNKIAVFRGQS